MARWQRKRTACQQCGGDGATCRDPKHLWYPQRSICFAAMETAAANAKYDRLHKDAPFHNGIMGDDGDFTSWSATQSDSHPYHFRDGVSIWAASTDLNPHDRFLG